MGFLKTDEQVKLRVQHRHERDGRVRDRIKAILLCDKGWSAQKIAEALMIDESTVRRHIEEYQEKQKLCPENGGSTSKLDPLQTEGLVKHLETTTYVYTKEICAYVRSTYGKNYSIPGMRSWLLKNGFSYKCPKGSPSKADPEKQAAFIEFYEKLLNKTSEDEPIEFGDGVHPTMATKVVRGWIRKGQDKLIPTTASRTRMNLFGSINLQTMDVTIDAYETIDSKATTAHFKKLREKYPNAPTIHLILDQGPYNKSLETKKAAKEYGITLHYLPPYSPNLNPIERLWKVMNEHVRNNVFFESVKEFREKILAFFELKWADISHLMVDRINDHFQIINPASSC